MVVLVVDCHHEDIENHQDPVDGKVEAEENVREEQLSQGAPQAVAAEEEMKKPSHSF